MSVLNFTHFTGAVPRCRKYGLIASEGILFFVPDKATALQPYDPFEDVDSLLLDVVKAGAEVANFDPFLDYCMAHKMLPIQDTEFWRHGDFFATQLKKAQPLVDTLLTFVERYGLPIWDSPVMTYYPARYEEQMEALHQKSNDDMTYLTVYEGVKRVCRKSRAVPVCTVALTLLNFYLQWIEGLNAEAFFIRNAEWMMYQGKEKAPKLSAQVHDLKECIHLAYALASSGEGKAVRQCKNCGKFFISTDWRSEYCSPNCRGAYNSKMTRKRVKSGDYMGSSKIYQKGGQVMPGKRSNGEGALRKRPNGLWECSIMVGYHDDGRRRYKSFYGKTQKEAKDKAETYKRDVEAGLYIDPNLTFQEWSKQWYEGYKDAVSPTTYESYGYTLAILQKAFGRRKLNGIKALDVENFLKGLRSDGKSDSSLAKCRGMLYQIMYKAEANDLIRKNPVRFAEKMKAQRPVKRKEAFTQEEVKTLMEKLPEDKVGHTIRLMLATGMRTQEVLALEPQHIEPDGFCIHVRQAVNMVKGTPHIGPTKTATSVRNVPVPSSVQHCAVYLREQAGTLVWESPAVPGQPVNPSYFRDKYRNSLFKVPGVRPLTPHSCRHTYVSQLQALGVDMETIQSMVGHADIEMTQHYLHVQEEARQTTAEKFSKAFGTAR